MEKLIEIHGEAQIDKNSTKFLRRQVVACFVSMIFHIPVGICMGYSAVMLPQMLLNCNDDIAVTKEQSAWIASISVLVVPVCAVVSGILVDKYGRIKILMLSMIPNLIGWTLIATASSVYCILIGRFFTGFTLSLATTPGYVYITEVARADLRGALTSCGSMIVSFGILLVYLLGWYFHWRTVAWISIVISIVPLLLSYLYSPESPQWLASQGRLTEAIANSKILSNNKVEFDMIQSRVDELETRKRKDENLFKTLKNASRRSDCYKPLVILSILFVFQNLAGLYILTYYLVEFLEDVGTSVSSNGLAALVAFLRMVCGIATGQLLVYFGKRTLLITATLSMAILAFTSGYVTNIIKQDIHEHNELKLIPPTCLILYICISSCGLLTIPWTMTAELFPLKVRGIMQGIVSSIGHIFMFSSVKSYYILSQFVGGSQGLQFLFSFICIFATLYIYLFLPETHKKTPNQIHDYFNSNTIFYKRWNQK